MNEISTEIQRESNVFDVSDFERFLRIGMNGTKESIPLLDYTGKLETLCLKGNF